MKKLIIVIFILITTLSFATNYYIDATNGNDSNDGKSPETAWRSIEKVNIVELAAGDSVLFKRGEIFRGNLVLPANGLPSAHITYGAYGNGDKPKLFGSYQKNSSSDWLNEGGNIWMTSQTLVSTVGPEILPNPDFDSDISNWDYTENAASSVFSRTIVASEYYSSPGGGKLECFNNGSVPSDIQISTFNWSISELKWYKLSLKAKATQQFTMNTSNIGLMKDSSPYTDYSISNISPAQHEYTQGLVYDLGLLNEITIATSWTTYELLYKANITASDARISFSLGNIIPDGAIFYLDSLSFKECSRGPDFLAVDVGNIIFNDESFCGIKIWEETDLDSQGEFWYDENNDLLKLYSISNPSEYYSTIEIARQKSIIDISNRSYIIFENLDLRYGGRHGISGINTHNIWIKDLDFSYIGGGNQHGGSITIRLGNGVEFWNAAHDNIVERCSFNQIYDAAMTLQGSDTQGFEAYNLYFRNNIVSNCEYSFEYWERDGNTKVNNIYFENNTCLNAGSGWGHTQRCNPNGTHLMLSTNQAQTNDFYIRNNIFYNSSDWGISWKRNEDINKLIVDNNCWYESLGPIAKIGNTFYDFATQWEAYKTASGQDPNSIAADPLLESYHSLQINSPCINTGMTLTTVTDDYDGVNRPQGSGYDIGAYESH